MALNCPFRPSSSRPTLAASFASAWPWWERRPQPPPSQSSGLGSLRRRFGSHHPRRQPAACDSSL